MQLTLKCMVKLFLVDSRPSWPRCAESCWSRGQEAAGEAKGKVQTVVWKMHAQTTQ